MKLKHLAPAMIGLALMATSAAAEIINASIRPGWRLADGRHVAGLHLRLDPGWKTYWRAPGDAGIPPVFAWHGSRNLSGVQIEWPRPDIFWQEGMRSVGYDREVLLPLIVTPKGKDQPVRLQGELQLGLCKDVCIPHTLRFGGQLSAKDTKPDARIAAALADRPFSEAEAQVQGVTCKVSPENKGLRLRAEIDMPSAGGSEVAIIEAGQPGIWVSEATSDRKGRTLVTEARMMHVDGRAFALDRGRVRITVLGQKHAVDIRGCRS